jgi:hypothetical protein
MQRISKHVPAAMSTHATIELLLETVFSTGSMQRGYKEDNWGNPVSWELSSAREAMKRWRYESSVVGYSTNSNDVSTEAEESLLLRAVTKQRLVTTLQAGEELVCSDL